MCKIIQLRGYYSDLATVSSTQLLQFQWPWYNFKATVVKVSWNLCTSEWEELITCNFCHWKENHEISSFIYKDTKGVNIFTTVRGEKMKMYVTFTCLCLVVGLPVPFKEWYRMKSIVACNMLIYNCFCLLWWTDGVCEPSTDSQWDPYAPVQSSFHFCWQERRKSLCVCQHWFMHAFTGSKTWGMAVIYP